MFLQSVSTMSGHFLQMVLHPLLMSYGLCPRTLPLWENVYTSVVIVIIDLQLVDITGKA